MKMKTKDKKKLKILAAADLHGSMDIAEKLAEKAKKNKVDLVVLAGDLHGPLEGGDIIEPFKKRNQKIVFVPGNWDSIDEVDIIKKKHKIKNLDGYYVTYEGINFVGFGNPDFRLFPDEKKTIEKLKKNFEKIKTKDGKKILVSHLHAAGSKAEFSGWEGDKGLRKAIDYFKPDIFISAHIHEAEGIEEKIGKTKVIQVGRKGRILEI
jgi:Icc-related predicted phosphoesterase